MNQEQSPAPQWAVLSDVRDQTKRLLSPRSQPDRVGPTIYLGANVGGRGFREA